MPPTTTLQGPRLRACPVGGGAGKSDASSPRLRAWPTCLRLVTLYGKFRTRVWLAHGFCGLTHRRQQWLCGLDPTDTPHDCKACERPKEQMPHSRWRGKDSGSKGEREAAEHLGRGWRRRVEGPSRRTGTSHSAAAALVAPLAALTALLSLDAASKGDGCHHGPANTVPVPAEHSGDRRLPRLRPKPHPAQSQRTRGKSVGLQARRPKCRLTFVGERMCVCVLTVTHGQEGRPHAGLGPPCARPP